MSKHSEGPWSIDWYTSRLDVFSADSVTLVATIQRSALLSNIDDTAKANARLIAAAPELLEALQNLLDWAIEVHSPRSFRINFSGMDKARDAIAKATRG